MRINIAFILCAGFGKRLNPLTLDTPKPLIKLKNIAVLETCINLIESLGIQQIILNTFYLKDQIYDFINNKKFKSKKERRGSASTSRICYFQLPKRDIRY